MEPNPIIAEIHRARDEIFRKCGYDVQKLMDYYREREREAKARGVKFVSLVKRTKKK